MAELKVPVVIAIMLERITRRRGGIAGLADKRIGNDTKSHRFDRTMLTANRVQAQRGIDDAKEFATGKWQWLLDIGSNDRRKAQ